MNFPISTAHKAKIGTCPHGLPQGACPICSGAGGGGGSSKKVSNPGEMSWDECNAVWQQMLKAKDLTQQKREQALHLQMQQQPNFTSKLNDMTQKLVSLIENLNKLTQTQTNNTKPSLADKAAEIGAKIAIPVLNIIKNVAVVMQKTITVIKEKFADISDKLNALFGELKNSIEKKISDKLNNFKKKFKSLFGITEPDDAEKQREYEIEELINKDLETETLFTTKDLDFTLTNKNKELIDANS